MVDYVPDPDPEGSLPEVGDSGGYPEDSGEDGGDGGDGDGDGGDGGFDPRYPRYSRYLREERLSTRRPLNWGLSS